MDYNQGVVKCQILQECFLQNFNNMQKFQNMEHSNSGTFQGPSKTYSVFKDFQGPEYFLKFKDFQGLLNDPMNPDLRILHPQSKYFAEANKPGILTVISRQQFSRQVPTQPSVKTSTITTPPVAMSK